VKKFYRALLVSIVAVLGLSTVVACSSVAPPDEVGLYYMKGPIDGNHFDHCFDPGTTTDWGWNNDVILLPASLRTWKIAEGSTDSQTPIIVPSAPEASQPSGVRMKVWTQTNFYLNTNCDNSKDSPIVQFWEKIGRRYKADETAGWKTMLENTIVTALTTTTAQVIRQYPADILVAGTAKEEIQNKISAAFTPELKRLAGGDFFCGPTFVRHSPECPPVEVLLLPIDYANEAIQAARDEKQAAIERASALVAEAQGKVAAAAAEAELYRNAVWVQLEIAKLHLEEVKLCAANPNCTVILDQNGGSAVNIQTG
jgi:hypothetical protein